MTVVLVCEVLVGHEGQGQDYQSFGQNVGYNYITYTKATQP